MSVVDIRRLPEANLTLLFYASGAGPRLEGDYRGEAWSFSHRARIALVNRVWSGKRFTGDQVLNKIGGLWVVAGHVTRTDHAQTIYYPRLRLSDEVRWVLTCYLGRMQLGSGVVWFTLTR